MGPGTLMWIRPNDPAGYLEGQIGEQSGLRQSGREDFGGWVLRKGPYASLRRGLWPCGRTGRRVPGGYMQ